MQLEQIVDFLLPKTNDLFQITFALVIFGLAMIVIVLVKKNAHADVWEHNWVGGTKETDNDLDAEHGSVYELSDAVASKSEKMAETLPGILLILGLLGTFVGLGIALNQASNVLNSANVAAVNGMGDTMAQMMGMMEGLGTKFKTSTWGIMGFLIIKFTTSWTGFEEKRLRWCIVKMNMQMDQTRERKESRAQENSLQLISAILDNKATVAAGNNALEKLLLINLNIKKAIDSQQNSLTELLDVNKEAKNAMTNFVDGNLVNVRAMANSSNLMANAAKDVGISAKELNIAIAEFKDNVADVLQGLKTDLGDTIENMNSNFGENLREMSTRLQDATEDISSAVGKLSEDVGVTLEKVSNEIEKSGQIQTKASVQFSTISENLQENILGMSGLTEKLSADIKSGLRAVSDSGLQVKSLTARYEEITGSAQKTEEKASEILLSLDALIKKVSQSSDGQFEAQAEIRKINHALELMIVLLEKLSEREQRELVGE